MTATQESWSDLDLICAIARLDRRGLAEAWRRYATEVNWVAIAHCSDPERANVALVAAFSDLWERPARAARRSSLLAFLVGSARTRCGADVLDHDAGAARVQTWLADLSDEQLAVAAAFSGSKTRTRDVARIVGLDVVEVARSLRTILTKVAGADDQRLQARGAPRQSSNAERGA